MGGVLQTKDKSSVNFWTKVILKQFNKRQYLGNNNDEE